MYKGNSIAPQEALDKIISQYTDCQTRGDNDLREVGVIYKEEIGVAKNDTLIPDTLAYLFESRNLGKQYIVSADNRTQQSLLAEFDALTEGYEMSATEVTIMDIIRKGIANYVKNEVRSYEVRKDSILSEVWHKVQLFDLSDSAEYVTRQPYPTDYGPDDEYIIDEYTLIGWHEVAFKDALIPVKWHQDEPYNLAVKDTLSCGTVPTGCVATAVAQIMAYWKNPLTINGQQVDWNSLTETERILETNPVKSAKVAALMKGIFIGCNTIPGCDGSTSNVQSAKSYFQSIGFSTGDVQSYSSSVIYSSLVNSRPVLITGTNSEYDGHAWIIDGYQRKSETIRQVIYVYDRRRQEWIVLRTQDHVYYSTLYHYNWGWRYNSLFDGWFAENCFDYDDVIYTLTRNASPSSYEYDVEIIPNIYPNNQ